MSSFIKLKEKMQLLKPNLQKSIKQLDNLSNSLVPYIYDAIIPENSKKIYQSDFNDCIKLQNLTLNILEQLLDDLSANLSETNMKLSEKENSKLKSSIDELFEMIELTKNKIAQSSSEFELFCNPKQITNFKFVWESVNKELIKTFKDFRDEIESTYNKLTTRTKPEKQNVEILKKISDRHYQFICSHCGELASEIKNELSSISDTITWKYFGLISVQEINENFYQQIKDLLDKKELKNLNQFWKEKINFKGVDSYCPDCDKFYCKRHYNLDTIYKNGIYEYTNGICPKGHNRKIK